MAAFQSRTTTPAIRPWAGGERQVYESEGELSDVRGLLEHSRQFILGGKAAKWLEDTGPEAFDLVRSTMRQAKRCQDVIEKILNDYDADIRPQVSTGEMGEDGFVTRDMTDLEFAKHLAELLTTATTATDKAITMRNKVATGGVNIMAGAMLAVGTAHARNTERSANPAPRKRYGAGARIEIQADAEVVE